MSELTWVEIAVVGQGVLIVVLFVRLVRVENVIRRVLGGWKRGR